MKRVVEYAEAKRFMTSEKQEGFYQNKFDSYSKVRQLVCYLQFPLGRNETLMTCTRNCVCIFVISRNVSLLLFVLVSNRRN